MKLKSGSVNSVDHAHFEYNYIDENKKKCRIKRLLDSSLYVFMNMIFFYEIKKVGVSILPIITHTQVGLSTSPMSTPI